MAARHRHRAPLVAGASNIGDSAVNSMWTNGKTRCEHLSRKTNPIQNVRPASTKLRARGIQVEKGKERRGEKVCDEVKNRYTINNRRAGPR